MLVVRRFRTAFDQAHGIEDGLNDRLVADSGVQHDVIKGAGGPVGVEVVFHVGDAFAVDGIDQFVGFRPAVAFGNGAADFFGPRSVEKNMEGVRMLSQEDKERRVQQ